MGNLNAHAHLDNQYPDTRVVLNGVRSGPPLYGRLALRDDMPFGGGSKLLLGRVDESEEPLWILYWGGATLLAQAVAHVDKNRNAAESALFRSKLRVTPYLSKMIPHPG